MLIIEMMAIQLANMMLIMINEDEIQMVNKHINRIKLFEYFKKKIISIINKNSITCKFDQYLIVEDVHEIYNVLN
jgi:hypothetical protein